VIGYQQDEGVARRGVEGRIAVVEGAPGMGSRRTLREAMDGCGPPQRSGDVSFVRVQQKNWGCRGANVFFLSSRALRCS
jgi:hypothetical protein